MVKESRVRKHTYKLNFIRSSKSHKAFNESKELMKQAKDTLKIFRDHEETKLKTSESRNRLESIMYRIPEYAVNEELMKYGTEEEVEDLKKTAKDLDDWFFEDEAYT